MATSGPKTGRVQVFRALEQGQLRRIGLSEETIRRLCPEATELGWTIESSVEEVAISHGIVVDWEKHGGCGAEHVHWICPLCDQQHFTDFDPPADSNPVLWFCEKGRGACLVHWQMEEPKWALIFEHGQFQNVPRFFSADYGKLYRLLFHCPFSQDQNEYADFYEVFLIPASTARELKGDWEKLVRRSSLYLGEVAVKDVGFDPSLRLAVHVSTFDRFKDVPGLSFYVGKRGR